MPTSGESLGWYREHDDMFEWSARWLAGSSRGGWASSEAEALERIADVLSDASGKPVIWEVKAAA
jgi:hypothetical protein